MAEMVVTVDRILADRKPWFLLLGMQEGAQRVVCKGTMAWRPEERDTLSLVGEYVAYKGERQFQFFSAKLYLPFDERSQLHYVCERTSGIGPAKEEAIWELLKENWRDLKNGEIKGLREKAFESFREEIKKFDENREKAQVLAWLESLGCTPAMAAAAYEKHGKETAEIINSDCYMLAYLPGYSFRFVDDKIRRNFNIADDDPRRLRSATLYALEQLSEMGSTAVSCTAHFEATQKLIPDIDPAAIIEMVNELKEDKKIVVFPKQNLMALYWDYMHEKDIKQFFQSAKWYDEDIFEEIADPDEWGMQLDEYQRFAVFQALTQQAAIINGGAGTGKTTIIKMIAECLKQLKIEVRLCAPTGKAAARLREATEMEATTIHSMLGYCGDGMFRTATLAGCAVIVDEASMVDSALMSAITSRNPARLVLVGDQAQLPPVGKGCPFHDLIELFPDMVSTLNRCYRNTEAVYHAAMQVRNGNIPAREQNSETERWVCVPENNPDEVQKLIVDYVQKEVIDFRQDIILCPKNGEKNEKGIYPAATVNALNEVLLKIDRKKRGENETEKFLPGDRVINTVNNPDCCIWNGTTGTVLSVSKDGLTIELDAPEVLPDGDKINAVFLDKDRCADLRYAYALTIHKSQGSQYRNVYIVALSRDKFQLDRSLLYTAITRTKQNCAVIGDYKTMIAGIQTLRRKTTILQILQ